MSSANLRRVPYQRAESSTAIRPSSPVASRTCAGGRGTPTANASCRSTLASPDGTCPGPTASLRGCENTTCRSVSRPAHSPLGVRNRIRTSNTGIAIIFPTRSSSRRFTAAGISCCRDAVAVTFSLPNAQPAIPDEYQPPLYVPPSRQAHVKQCKLFPASYLHRNSNIKTRLKA